MTPPTEFLPGPGTPGLVSVLIATYNRANFISETLNSVLAQTYPNFEAIVLDDGSTDDTRTVVAGFADPRIRYFHQANGGLSSARNAALEQAGGEFIACLDSDDVWLPWKLAAQVAAFRLHEDVGLVWSDMSTFDKAGRMLAERHLRSYYSVYARFPIEEACERAGTVSRLESQAPASVRECPYYVGDISRQMFLGNFVHPPTAIVRRSRLRLAGRYQPEVTVRGGEDYHLYYRVSQHGPVAFIDAPTTLYRVHEEQMSTVHAIHDAHADLRLVRHWLEQEKPALPKSVVKRRLASAHGWVGHEELFAGNPRAALPHLWHSVRLHPRQPSKVGLLLVSMLPKGAVPAIRALKHAVRPLPLRGMLWLAALISTGVGYILYRLMVVAQPEFVDI